VYLFYRGLLFDYVEEVPVYLSGGSGFGIKMKGGQGKRG